MNVLSKIKGFFPGVGSKLTTTIMKHDIGRVAYKHAPLIWTCVGIGLQVVGTIFAVKGHEKAMYALDEYEYEKIAMGEDGGMSRAYLAKTLTKAYLPSVAAHAGGILCILEGHHISHGRIVAVTTLAVGAQAQLEEYRARVIADQGEEKDLLYLHGGVEKEIETTKITKSGKEKKVKKTVTVPDPYGVSKLYSIRVKPGDGCWNWDLDYLLLTLTQGENYFNRKLAVDGFVTINDIVRYLRILKEDGSGELDIRQEWQITGWYKDNPRGTDGYISLGLGEREDYLADFREECGIVLEFNTDGVIYDLL